jgi:hypothetical protein
MSCLPIIHLASQNTFMRSFIGSAVASIFFVVAAHAQAPSSRQFSFEGIPLGAKLEQLSIEQRKSCETSRDKRFVFCDLSSHIEGVTLQATLSFDQGELSEIQIYFPAQHADLVWSALRAKYGMEDFRSPEKQEWYSNPMRPDLPIPDELILFRVAEKQPTPDGARFIAAIPYAMLEYRSMKAAREGMQRRSKDRMRRVQELKGKL